jgi:uncharacterized protein (TIGR03435 family)
LAGGKITGPTLDHEHHIFMDLFPERIVGENMRMQWVIPALFASVSLFGQGPPERSEFEVASIKPSAPLDAANGRPVNIGIRIDGAQYHSNSFSLKDYIRIAHRVKDYQVICPDWVASERFDISAKIPAGAPRDKTPEMLRALLEDRFGLKLHHDKKDLPVYGLVVVKGEKLKESPPDSEEDKAEAAKAPVDVAATGGRAGVNVNYGHGSFFALAENKLEVKKLTMAIVAEALGRFMDRPVIDMTELKGNYDLKLAITEEDYRAMLIRSAISAGYAFPPEVMKMLASATDDSLYSALAANGLKLEPRKAPLDVIVVDHVEKSPTAN